MLFKDRLCTYGVLPAVLRPTAFVSTVVYVFLGYFSSFQFIAHCVIACNRYTVIIHPLLHAKVGTSLYLQNHFDL